MKLPYLSILSIPALALMGCMGTSDSAQIKANKAKADHAKAGDAHDHDHGKPETKHDEAAHAADDAVKTERDKLSAEDRALVEAQEWCVISKGNRLGVMGAPIKVMVKDQPVFLCCAGCKDAALNDEEKTLATLNELKAKKKSGKPADDHGDAAADATIKAERDKLSAEDRKLVDAQEWCVISTDERLGVMGAPVKVMIKDQPVFLCCKGCEKTALADPDKTLAKVEELKAKKKAGKPAGDHDHGHAGHHNATDADIEVAREKLSAEDLKLVESQEWCAVMPDDRLGCSGAPIKLTIKGQTVFICCKGCEKDALADPDKTLAKVEEMKAKAKAAKQPK